MISNEIWVMAEFKNGRLTRTTRQVLGAARGLAGERGLVTAAVQLGGGSVEADNLARRSGLVLRVDDQRLDDYDVLLRLQALERLVAARGAPAALLAPASISGLELLPGLAARLDAPYAGSCTALRWEREELAARRPVYGGKIYEELLLGGRPAIATVRSGAYPVPDDPPDQGRIETIRLDLDPADGPKVTDRQTTESAGRSMVEAERVVAGGRGMGGPEGFKLVEDLASALDAAVGATRALVDAGERPLDEQVGKSGRTISPELYIACGVSGAIHHTLGMSTSKVVAAINTDPEALIFQHADYGIVGNAREVVPALIEALAAGAE